MFCIIQYKKASKWAGLDRAMDVFWRNGYSATSTDDLMDAMGIGRGSFYNTFGSKRETYLRTLDRYLLQLSEGGPYRALTEGVPGVAALEALFDSYLESVAARDGAHGCYFVHVAKEHRGADPEVTRAIRRGIAKMRVIISEHLRIAQEHGFLPEHVDPKRASLLLMALAWGAHVLIEAGIRKADALAAVKVVFELTPSTT